MITHMVVFNVMGLIVGSDSAVEELTVAVSNKELSGTMLWLGRTRTAVLMALLLSVLIIRFRTWTSDPSYRPLTAAFAVYWAGALLIPAFAAGEFTRVYAYAYPLLTGLAMATVASGGRRQFFAVLAWTVLIATVSSLLVFVVSPKTVSEIDYEDAIFGAFPRFQGFTVQANALGMTLAPWLLLLLRWPLRPRWVNRIAWAAGIIALLASQSKTSIAGFTVAAGWMLLTAADGRGRRLVLTVLPPLVLGVAGSLMLAVSLGYFPSLARDALTSVTTVTGRSLIWSIALDAWQSNPWFGYGPDLFIDGTFDSYQEVRRTVHAHNQAIDTLARAGLLGLFSLLILCVALAVGVARLRDADRALGIALGLLLMIQSFSETPMGFFNGPMNTSYWALMALVASGSSAMDSKASSDGPSSRPQL